MLITRPAESYRVRYVCMCDIEISRVRMPWAALGRSATKIMEPNKSPALLILEAISVA
jgi:hypothetical protein